MMVTSRCCLIAALAMTSAIASANAQGIANKDGNVVVSMKEGGNFCIKAGGDAANCVNPTNLVGKPDLETVRSAAKAELQAKAAEVQTSLDALTQALASDKEQTTADIEALGDDFVLKLGNVADTVTSETDTKFAAVNSKLDKILNCAKTGKMLGADDTCVTIFPECAKTPTVTCVGCDVKASAVKFEYLGTPVPGTHATFVCPSGYYSAVKGSACQVNGKWSTLAAQCKICDSNSPADECGHAWDSCRATFEAGLPSGRYMVQGHTGVAEVFCLNDESLGWKLGKSGKSKGGGWEIVHTQVGGDTPGVGKYSNRHLRTAHEGSSWHGYLGPTHHIFPFNIKKDGYNARKKPSQMAHEWHEHARTPNMQWMKFIVAYQGSTKKYEDRHSFIFKDNTDMVMNWFFRGPSTPGSNNNHRQNSVFYGRSWCLRMPGKVEVEINDVAVGQTNTGVGSATSMGLANEGNDRCGQSLNNVIRAKNAYSKHKFRRIDGGNQDNSMRHSISYTDTATDKSASRCTYCCWGCGGWIEMVMWGVRPVA